MKTARILLRVSSNQQLDADGNLNVQRDIIKEYIEKNEEWILDDKEYFEGGVSGYKNAVKNRDVLQEALYDAQRKEYDILVVYKDDRVGRRMWEIGAYVMQLKEYGVDIYTVKDGCISPSNDDIMGQMMLALRYGNAQKSSSDTGMRVKDTAQKLVKQGKFMGGKAPYGYELVFSGEISKHGRALKKLQIVPEKAEIVKYIYELSLYKEYGSAKISRILNTDEKYKGEAVNDFWKAGTITSIITNPIYAGITAYKRREKTNGKYHKLGSDDWIYADDVNPEIAIIDIDDWNETQRKRRLRANEKISQSKKESLSVIRENKGQLALIDVIYCGYCGHKLTNGTKYSYWTLRGGQKCCSKINIYKCQLQWGGVPHEFNCQYKAEEIESVVFEKIAEYINGLQDDKEMFNEITKNNQKEKKTVEKRIADTKKEIQKIDSGINIMKEHLPEAILGTYIVKADILSSSIEQHEIAKEEKMKLLYELEKQYSDIDVNETDWDEICKLIPSWKEVFHNADKETKRVLINRIVDKIIVKEGKITIKFKINLQTKHNSKPRIGTRFVVQKHTSIRDYISKNIMLKDLIIKI